MKRIASLLTLLMALGLGAVACEQQGGGGQSQSPGGTPGASSPSGSGGSPGGSPGTPPPSQEGQQR